MSFSSKTKFYYSSEIFRLGCAVAGGIISALPFFADWLFFIEWFSFVPFFLIFTSKQSVGAKKAFLYGFLNHFSKSVLVLSWFKELALMANLGFPAPLMLIVIFFVIIAISAIQSIPFGLCAILYETISEKSKSVLSHSIYIATLYTAAELLMTTVAKLDLPAFPWVMTYITQGSFICGIQSASVFGAHFISFLIILFNALIANVFFCNAIKKAKCIALAVIAFASNMLYGILYIDSNDAIGTLNAVIYQDNNSSYDKWDKLSIDTYDIFEADIKEFVGDNRDTDIILMSETVFTTIFNTDLGKSSVYGRYIQDKLTALSNELDTSIACGAFTEIDGKRYNSVYLFENGMMHNGIYNKHNLVPFGEYIPGKLSHTLPFLNNFNLGGKELSPGTDHHVFRLAACNAGALVCYDALFYNNAVKSVENGAHIMLMSTNDSWYNDSAAVYQHFTHAAFRAIETHRTIIRSAATGISGIIDCHGRTALAGSLLKKDILSGPAALYSDITPFVKHGYSYMYALLLFSAIYTAMCCYNKKTVPQGGKQK